MNTAVSEVYVRKAGVDMAMEEAEMDKAGVDEVSMFRAGTHCCSRNKEVLSYLGI